MNIPDSRMRAIPFPMLFSTIWYTPKAIINTAIMSLKFLLNILLYLGANLAKTNEKNFTSSLVKLKMNRIFARCF